MNNSIPPQHMTDGELFDWCYRFRDWATRSGHHADRFPENIRKEMRLRANRDRPSGSRFDLVWTTYMKVWKIIGLY